jgi:hypothetical protein
MYENGSMVALIFGKVNAKAPPAEEEFQGSRKVLWSNNPVSERWKITEEQYARIKDCLPVQRGNASLSNLQFLNAGLYVVEHGCKWRGLTDPSHRQTRAADGLPEFHFVFEWSVPLPSGFIPLEFAASLGRCWTKPHLRISQMKKMTKSGESTQFIEITQRIG